ncbi:MAG: FxsA family protein [Pseudolabrys sp.]|nr:FxsA family protein [Pseudolabrys sp.]
MNVAKWLLLALLAVPLMELAVFVAVAVAIGFGWAFLLVVGASIAGILVLRHAGGNHIARVRVALDQGNLTALQADGQGGTLLLAGFLLLIPGFITDVLALLLLFSALRQSLAGPFGRRTPPPRADGVVDLEPEQWRRVPDPALERQREDNEPRR